MITQSWVPLRGGEQKFEASVPANACATKAGTSARKWRPWGVAGEHLRRSCVTRFNSDVMLCHSLDAVRAAIKARGPKVVRITFVTIALRPFFLCCTNSEPMFHCCSLRTVALVMYRLSKKSIRDQDLACAYAAACLSWPLGQLWSGGCRAVWHETGW